MIKRCHCDGFQQQRATRGALDRALGDGNGIE